MAGRGDVGGSERKRCPEWNISVGGRWGGGGGGAMRLIIDAGYFKILSVPVSSLHGEALNLCPWRVSNANCGFVRTLRQRTVKVQRTGSSQVIVNSRSLVAEAVKTRGMSTVSVGTAMLPLPSHTRFVHDGHKERLPEITFVFMYLVPSTWNWLPADLKLENIWSDSQRARGTEAPIFPQ